jgi:hypothetical protein
MVVLGGRIRGRGLRGPGFYCACWYWQGVGGLLGGGWEREPRAVGAIFSLGLTSEGGVGGYLGQVVRVVCSWMVR